MEHTFYKGSSKVSPLAILWIPITLIISLLLGLLYGLIVYHNPIIYLSVLLFLGFCVVLGMVAHSSIRMSKCRNKWVALTLGLTLGGGATYISYVYLVSKLAGLSLAEVVLMPAGLWNAVQMIADQGYYSVSDAEVSGFFLWIVWGIEAAGLVGVPVLLSWSLINSRVFCENCNEWADEDENIAQFSHSDEESLKGKFLAQDLSFLKESQPIDQNTKTYYSIDEELCKKCNKLFALSLRRNDLSIEDGKVSTSTLTIYEDLLVSQDTHDQLGHIDEEREKEYLNEFSSVLKMTMALMVLADGKVEDDEIDSMLKIYRNFSEDEPTTDEMRAAVEFMRDSNISVADFTAKQADRFSHEAKVLLIKASLMIASADGELREEEIDGVFAMANGLGLTKEEFDDIIGE